MDKKLIVILGGVILCVGTFLPIANGAGQSVSFMMPGDGDAPVIGIILAVCGALGLVLAFLGQAKWAVIPGLIALGLVIWKYLQLKGLMDQATATIQGMEVPPEMQAQVAAATPSINYLGWGALVVGALILLVGGAMAWKSSPAAPAA
jgi:hypothetical protein